MEIVVVVCDFRDGTHSLQEDCTYHHSPVYTSEADVGQMTELENSLLPLLELYPEGDVHFFALLVILKAT